MKKRMKKLALYGGILVVVGGILSILAVKGFRIPCLFYEVTGLLCPGCGNTRAVVSLLRLDIPAAFWYNPLFPLEFFYIFWVTGLSCRTYLKTGRFAYRPKSPAFDIIVLVMILAWWVARNFLQRGLL